MVNVKMKCEKDVLTVTIDLKKRGHLSKSGRSTIIASTEGNVNIPEISENAFLGLNLYIKE